MKYDQTVTLKNGAECRLRNGTEKDGQAAWENFNLTHGQTDYLLSYPDENSMDAEQEGRFLREKSESKNEIQLVALVDGVIVGMAGIEAVGDQYKVRHRAEFGLSVDEAFWGLGIGRALMDACIACGKKAGYIQLELNVVAENQRAILMYEQAGFVEFGRNPKGFLSRTAGFQEMVYMRLEL